MTDEQFLSEVKRTVLAIDPQAEVWLFGSRARGDSRPDSDWDFLVLTNKHDDQELKRSVRNSLFDVELNSSNVIGTVIHAKRAWESDYGVTPLYRNIRRDGRQL